MTSRSSSSAESILGRIVRAEDADWSAAASQAILTLKFTDYDLERMRELLDQNNAGTISRDDSAELQRYWQIGSVLDLLHAKARLSLRQVQAA